MKKKRFGIVVAGMHRSGTSAATGALQRLGIVLGDGLMAGADDNPKGYFEHEAVVGIHDELLRELGSWWSDPRALPDGWLGSPAARRAEERLVALLRRDFSDAPVWAIKDPRACRLLPLWRRCLGRLKWAAGVLHVVRSPTEVAASLTSRNGFSRSLGELLWLRHVSAAIRDSSGLARTVLLYESLLADPPGSMQRALATLGVALPTIAETEADSLEGFVDPDFRHHSDLSTVPGNRLSELAGQMFQGYRELAAGGRDWRALEELSGRFETEWSAMEPLVGSVAESVFPELDSRVALQSEVREVRSQLYAQIAWSEQAVIDHASVAEARDQLASQLHQALLSLKEAEAAQSRLHSDLEGQKRWAEQAVVEHRATVEQRDALAAARDELATRLQQAQIDLALARTADARLKGELDMQLQRAEQAAIEHRATVEQRDACFAMLQQAHKAQALAQEELSQARADAISQATRADLLDSQLCQAREAAATLMRVNAELKLEHDGTRREASALRVQLTDAAAAAGVTELERNRLEAEIARLDLGAAELRIELATLKASKSWRWTAPLRAIVHLRRRDANSMSSVPPDDPAIRTGHDRSTSGVHAENQSDSGKENRP
jgi:hypothetical protein